jgi:lipoprotein-anchoring transpeptidase ErfK/SrfK
VSRHRAEARPRWGRIGLTTSAVAVVVLAVLAGFGVFSPSSSKQVATDAGLHVTAARSSASADPSTRASTGASTGASSARPAAGSAAGSAASAPASASASGSSAQPASGTETADETALPAGSGTGRRAVFDQSMQRVWIVDASGKVERTYPVSGSDENNLRPGTYHVYSKSRWAVGIDDSGVMQYFVRFAHGTDNGASIGFHSIPTKNGKPLQTVAQLGERLSHGCIRQKTSDAIAMWNFASVGTKVVVVA